MNKLYLLMIVACWTSGALSEHKRCNVVMPIVTNGMLNIKPWEPDLRPYQSLSGQLDAVNSNAEHIVYYYPIPTNDHTWIEEVIYVAAVTTDPAIPISITLAPISSLLDKNLAAFAEVSGVRCMLRNGHEAKIYIAVQSLNKFR